MKTLLLLASAFLANAIAAPGANAQISVGGSTANLPTPQGTIGTTGPNVSGASSSLSTGNYGPGNFGPGTVGPGNFGPGAYGPGNLGPGAYTGGSAGPAAIAATDAERR
jgi:hypothetical protein